MSDVKWCDHGKHPFSVLDEGWQRMTLQEAYQDPSGNMQSRNRVLDVCAQHAVSTVNREPVEPPVTAKLVTKTDEPTYSWDPDTGNLC